MDRTKLRCGGYWIDTGCGREFDCEYEPPFTCEKCIINDENGFIPQGMEENDATE